MSLLWVDLFRQPKWAMWLVTEGRATWLSPLRSLFILEVVTEQSCPQDRLSVAHVSSPRTPEHIGTLPPRERQSPLVVFSSAFSAESPRPDQPVTSLSAPPG